MSKTVQGTLDSPLSDLGRNQALRLKLILPKFDHIFSSPLSRASDTATLATGIMKSSDNYTEFKELVEIDFGTLQGTSYYDVPYEREVIQRHVRFEEDVLQGKHNAERLDQFFNRTHQIFDHIVEHSIKNKWNNIGIFTHGGFLRSVLQYKLKLSEGRYENTEVAKLTLNRNQMFWQLERLNDHIIF